jgi:hypothetical protein
MAQRVALLGTIAGSFVVGSVVGALAAVTAPHTAIAIPIIALGACSIYAFVSGRRAA